MSSGEICAVPLVVQQRQDVVVVNVMDSHQTMNEEVQMKDVEDEEHEVVLVGEGAVRLGDDGGMECGDGVL